MSKVPKGELVMARAMPSNEEAERMVLGSLLIDDSKFAQVNGHLKRDDFSLEKHRRIFSRMVDIHERQEKIDRMTVAHELMRFGELEQVDGISYIVSLDDKLPHISNIDSYVRIVRDQSALRRIAILGQHQMNRALLAEDTPEVIMADSQRELAELSLLTMNDARALNLRGVVEKVPGGINSFLAAQTRAFRMSSGFLALDDLMYGFMPKKSYVIAGDTSHGKTTLALNLAQHMALKGHPGLYFTVEMSREEMLHRMVCAKAEVSLSDFTHGRCGQRERAALSFAANELADLPLYLDDTANLTAADIVTQAHRAKQKYGIKWIVIDYIQIVDYAANPVKGGRPLTEYEGLTALSRTVKMLAKSLDICIIILSQFSKSSERSTGKIRRPIISDLHGSGAMGKDADVVMFVWRPFLHNSKLTNLKDHAELILAKHRGGPLGFVNLEFKGAYTRFYESDSQIQVEIG